MLVQLPMAKRNSDGEVRAVGGLVLTILDGRVQILLVHRPAYDDCSIPKGKASKAESDEQTALREVFEETGLTCTLGAEVGAIHYIDSKGRAKLARYWLMTEQAGSLTPTEEVDVCHVIELEQAIHKASRPGVQVFLSQLHARLRLSDSGAIVLRAEALIDIVDQTIVSAT
jgi:8-oxo-dGTP diphosphatase